jgi:hypothetical protein
MVVLLVDYRESWRLAWYIRQIPELHNPNCPIRIQALSVKPNCIPKLFVSGILIQIFDAFKESGSSHIDYLSLRDSHLPKSVVS